MQDPASSSLFPVIVSFTGSLKSSVTASSSRLISDSSEGDKVETGGVCWDEAMGRGWDGDSGIRTTRLSVKSCSLAGGSDFLECLMIFFFITFFFKLHLFVRLEGCPNIR